MENGSHLVLALLAPACTGTGGNWYRYRRHLRRHCDGVTGKKKIWRTHGTLDVNNLTALKG